MSDILIRGMEIPNSCWECKLTAEYDGETFCPFFADNVEYWIAAGRRHEDCPLGYIQPHGRLIDADELAKELQTSIDDMSYLYIYESQEERDCITRGLVNAKDAVSSAPTIIPASE